MKRYMKTKTNSRKIECSRKKCLISAARIWTGEDIPHLVPRMSKNFISIQGRTLFLHFIIFQIFQQQQMLAIMHCFRRSAQSNMCQNHEKWFYYLPVSILAHQHQHLVFQHPIFLSLLFYTTCLCQESVVYNQCLEMQSQTCPLK